MLRTKRGGRKRVKKAKSLSLYYVNINGYTSKKESLINILNVVKPDIIGLVETKLSKGKSLEIEGWEVVKRNCSKGKGGVMCALKKGTFHSVRNVTHTDDEHILSVRVSYKYETVRFIVAYGPQENEEVDTRKEFFTKLGIEIEKAKLAGEGVMVIGDLNAKIEQISENNDINACSGNGTLLKIMIEDLQLSVMNFSPQCKGVWTWSKTIKGVKHTSRLDYLIVNKNFSLNVKEMEIDEDKAMCPFYKVKNKEGNCEIRYSDHNPIITELELIPSTTKEPKEKRWIMTAKGLQKFEELTETFTCKEGGYNGLERALTNTMQKCFKSEWKRKSTEELCCSSKQIKFLRFLCQYKKEGKMQRIISEKYIKQVHRNIADKISEMKRSKVENTVKSLTVGGRFSPNEFWKLRKELCPQARMEKTSVILENGDEIYGDQAVRDAYKSEFENRLQHFEMKQEYRMYEERTNELCELYVKAAGVVKTPDYTVMEVKKVIRSLKNKKAATIPNEIYKHAGEGLVKEITRVINLIKNYAGTPKQWNKVFITALFKNKGSRKKLVFFRGIFLTESFSKIFEKLIMLRKGETLNSVSANQNGATSGKSPADNMFLLNACIDHSKYLNKALFLCFYDFEQCFDKLWLEDCIVGMWNIGVRDEMLSLILSLNEETDIIVKTPCGKTEPFSVRRIVKQGTVIGPQLCKVSTAEYGDDTPGFQLGLVNIKPPIFVDDILTMTGSIADSDVSHEKAIFFQFRKRSRFGKTKCVLIVVNGKKTDVPPVLEVDGHVMAQVEKTKYVGDIVNQKGTNSDLIDDRMRKGTGAMISILALCEESGLGRYTVQSIILLYNTTFIQMLLSNCQSWSHITQENLKSLQKLQLKFLKLALWLPLSVSNTFIFLELGILPLSHEVQKRRLNYLHHVVTLPESDPVSLAYHQGLRLIYEKNWANDIGRLRIHYNLTQTDEEVSKLSYNQWKEIVSRNVDEVAFFELLQSRSESSKLKNIAYESFKCQPYLSQIDAKTARRIAGIRSRTVSCKRNHKQSYRNLACRAGCDSEENQDHLMNCVKIHGNVTLLESSFAYEIDVNKDLQILREAMRRMDTIEKFMNGS